MKSAGVLVAEIQGLGIMLDDVEGALQFKARAGASVDAVRDVLVSRKNDILAYCRARAALCLPPCPQGDQVLVPSLTQEMWWRWIDRDTSLTLTLIEPVAEQDAMRVIQAVRNIVAAHDSLRSWFQECDGVLTVALNDADGFVVESETFDETGQSDLKSLVDAFVARPLTASASWLTRAKVLSLPGKGCVVVLVINHLVVDGTSIDLIRAELRQRLARDEAAEEVETRIGYAAFAHWQRQLLSRSGSAPADYWRGWVKTQAELQSPLGGKAMRWQSGRKVRRNFVIPPFAHQALAAFARQHGSFTHALYLTLFALAIARWSGATGFAIRSICDARSLPEFRGLVGLMTGADAIHAGVDPGRPFAENLRVVEAEYRVACKLRLPTLYAFPPYEAGGITGQSVQRDNIGMVLNFRTSGSRLKGEPEGRALDVWPPIEGVPRHDVWRHHVSPVCLEITQMRDATTAAFLLHEDILSVEEQGALISTFFAVFGDVMLVQSAQPEPDGAP